MTKWISVKDRLPKVEEEVLVLAVRKYIGWDGKKYIITTGIYEDGNMDTNHSIWGWSEIEFWGTYNEDEDYYLIPEGWWEYRHYNPDDVYNNAIDAEVVAWMPLPEPPEEE